ncbi:uncharacterized LOC729966 homolog [Sciurus carolinensis]|uniref:uncharacterized LOC729966 homolog n=1 Tax=Sciurus carolinensis TaxID=30640 RepID=UPI001FB41200|nr:uncharacterized LOC729966 homolog [Sciurus carolinensis]
MASSQLLLLPLLALALLRKPPGNPSAFASTGVAFALMSKIRGSDATSSSSSYSSLEPTSTSPLSLSIDPSAPSHTTPSSTGETVTIPTNHTTPSSTGETVTIPTSHTTPSSTGVTATSPLSQSAESSAPSHASPSSTNPNTDPTSAPPGTDPHPGSGSPSSGFTHSTHGSSTHLASHWIATSPSAGQSDPGVPSSHRNPGVVVAVCLLVSVLLIGSVVMAVKSCHRDASRFHKLDEESMENTSQRSSSANQPPEWLSEPGETRA